MSAPSRSKPSLEILKGVSAGERFELTSPETVLGRHSDCGVVLPSQTISRQHARIIRSADRFYIEDLQSLNGTFINGVRIEVPTRLRSGDQIQVQDIVLEFREPPEQAADTTCDWPPADEDDLNPSTSTHGTPMTSLDIWSGPDQRVEVDPQTKLRAILGIIRNVGSSLDIDEVLPKLLDSLFHIFPQADRAYILLAEGGRLLPRAIKHRSQETGSGTTIGPISNRLARQAMAQGRALLSSDTADGRTLPTEGTIFDVELQDVMCAPLMVPSSPPLGVIQIGAVGSSGHFLEQDLEVLANIALLAGQLLEYARWHERKRAEEVLERERVAAENERRRLRAVLNILPVGVFVMDAQGRILETNPEASVIWGGPTPLCERPDQYSDYYRGWWPNSGRALESHEWGMARAIRDDEAGNAEEIEIETFDGRRRTILSYALPIHDFAGKIVGGIAVNVDITERKRTEEALKKADRQKDDFLAMLGHELRNPLAALTNALTLLDLTETATAAGEHVREIMRRQLRNMARLIDDLLDAARVMRGKITLQREPLDVAGVVSRAVETSRPMIDERRHELSLSLPARPVRIDADPTRLEQILVNLLHNAAKYTEPGGRIQLAVETLSGEIEIRVCDSGIGMTRETLAHAFDLFAQAERTLDRSQGGLGIGLTMVKNLVELHGGRITAQSEGLGKGSQFIMRLPAAAEPAPVVEDASPDARERSAAETCTRRVLLVEDNVDSAATLNLLLERWGCTVCTAPDGPSALNLARDFQPDVALLDIGLPGMDGYEVARQLRTQPGNDSLYLIALTGYGREEDLRQSREAGFHRHLTKPVQAQVLQKLLHDLEPVA